MEKGRTQPIFDLADSWDMPKHPRMHEFIKARGEYEHTGGHAADTVWLRFVYISNEILGIGVLRLEKAQRYGKRTEEVNSAREKYYELDRSMFEWVEDVVKRLEKHKIAASPPTNK